MTNRLLFLPALFLSLASFGRETEDSLDILLGELKRMDSIENTFKYQTGKIDLAGGAASIHVPAQFKYLDASQSRYVLQDLWGNPDAGSVLGMIFPANSGAMVPGGYAFVIQFEEMGYVKDSDADKIDYDDLLKDLKESSAKENEERLRLGLQTMNLVGWAAKPYYDKEKKVLHWAKEFEVQGSEENTLNYDIRVLGRKGVLILQAVSDMSELDSVNNHIGEVLGMVSFNEGHRYADFDEKTDNVAAWTIGGLVAGKVLAKVGFFAVILKFLKFILVGVALAGGAVWKWITGRRKKDEELAYEAQPAENEGSVS